MLTAITVGIVAVISVFAGIFCDKFLQSQPGPSKTLWGIIASGFLLAMFVLSAFIAWPRPPLPQPQEAILHKDGHGIYVYDQNGKVLFTLANPSWDKVRVVVSEIDGDTDNEVIVSYQVKQQVQQGVLTKTFLDVYDRKGGLRWSHPLGDPSPWNPRLVALDVEGVEVRRFVAGRDGKQIAYVARDPDYYPSQIGMVDNKNNLIGELWLPGHVHQLTSFRPDEKHNYLLAGRGLDNDLTYVAGAKKFIETAFVLNPSELSGRTFVSGLRREHPGIITYRLLWPPPPPETIKSIWIMPILEGSSQVPMVELESGGSQALYLDKSYQALLLPSKPFPEGVSLINTEEFINKTRR